MRKFLQLFSGCAILIWASNANAQLYVANNEYMFVGNTYVSVEQNVELQNGGAILLREESQLLQKTSAVSANRGNGFLSVFQEGTGDNFDYNYWCSPVGEALNIAGNSPAKVGSLFYRPTDVINATPAVILPNNQLDGTAVPLQISRRWLYKFVTSNAYANWVSVGNNQDINPGEGFTMKGTSGTDAVNADGTRANNTGGSQRIDFRGKPNDGNIAVAVATGMRTLVGNPYPSAINLNHFLLDPANLAVTNGTAYFWEHNNSVDSHVLVDYQGGYGTYVANNGLNSPGTYVSATWNTYNNLGELDNVGASSGQFFQRMFSPIGQGFKVEGTANGVVTMKNAYRVFVKEGASNNSVFNREHQGEVSDKWEDIPNVAGIDYTMFSKEVLPQIKIHTIINDQYSREVALAFNPNSSDEFELGVDGFASEPHLPRDVFFPLEGADGQFVINTLPFHVEKRIPFALKADQNTVFEIYVATTENFDTNQQVYVYDKVFNTYHNIKESVFQINVDEGVHTDRFEITFIEGSVLSAEDLIKSDLYVVQNNHSQLLELHNNAAIQIKSFQVFDINGKKLIDDSTIGTNERFTVSTDNWAESIYIVKVISNEGDIAQKILVRHY